MLASSQSKDCYNNSHRLIKQCLDRDQPEVSQRREKLEISQRPVKSEPKNTQCLDGDRPEASYASYTRSGSDQTEISQSLARLQSESKENLKLVSCQQKISQRSVGDEVRDSRGRLTLVEYSFGHPMLTSMAATSFSLDDKHMSRALTVQAHQNTVNTTTQIKSTHSVIWLCVMTSL